MKFSWSFVNDWKFRHLGSLAFSVAVLFVFWAWRPEWSPMHRWNRAFADASLVVIAVVMVLGPLSRLWRRATVTLVWRRELGVWGFVAGLVHAVIILFGWVNLEWQRLFGFEFHPELQQYVMFDKGFGLGNVIGVLALIYGLLLVLTSNDISQRWMGMSIWKFFQQGAYILWALIVAHTAYFLFMHFLDFHRQTPEPNALQWPFVGLISLVLLVQTAASVRTWRLRRSVAKA
ncbi:MAG: ferric reductase-like transmembrane domain-containing protein [Paracoccaceae bacterium]